MKSYNPKTGQIEGTNSYNFSYASKDSIKKEREEKEASKLLVPSTDLVDSTGAKLETKKHALAEIDYAAKKKEIRDYNESLLTIPDECNTFILNGNALIIRLFKHDPWIMSSLDPNVMIAYSPIVIPYQDPTAGGEIKTKESPLQFIPRGVIVNMTGTYSENFKANFKVGDVIDIKHGVNIFAQRFWINPNEMITGEFNNYFSVNENLIEKKIL